MVLNTRIRIIVLLGLLVAGIVAIQFFRGQRTPVACTLEAKLCPDGSAVGRIGPSCEFAPCPTVGTMQSGIVGTVLLGPQCPVIKEGEDCPDKPYQTKLAVTTPDGARVITQFDSDKAETFRVSMPAGNYAIRSAAAANVLPYCTADAITVTVGAYTQIVVSCDTGVR